MDAPPAPRGPSWATLLRHWALIEQDLHDVYGIDVADRDLLRRRSWRWLKTRITGLLDLPPAYVALDERLVPVPATRLGLRLNPPPFD